MSRTIQVRAPCRLHFGMLGFGQTGQPQFGGVGVMVDPPAVDVRIAAADRFSAPGSLAERTRQFVATAARHWQLSALPACRIDVCSPPDHTGLGVGTQLALSVAAGLRRFLDLPRLPPDELAASVGRGARSAVGTYGFHHGGLIVDGGKRVEPSLGTLMRRVALPRGWRFVLVRPAGRGLAGDVETRAFAKLPPVSTEVTRQLWRIAEHDMLPAVERAECAAFGEAVYRFGHLAGRCFAPVQGGPFANEAIARLVAMIRGHGVPGVGQSSWGPTIFAIVENEAEADALRGWLRQTAVPPHDEITIAKPSRHGATISQVEGSA